MSNPGTDQIQDYIIDHEDDLLQEYTESEEGIKFFTDFLWDKKNDEVRKKLLRSFAGSNDGEKYREWAWEHVRSVFDGPDDNPAEDR